MRSEDLNAKLRARVSPDREDAALRGVIAATLAEAAGAEDEAILEARRQAESGPDPTLDSYGKALREGRLNDAPEALRVISPLG